jgi:hypothetical protein
MPSLERLPSHHLHSLIEDMKKLSVCSPVLPSVMLRCHAALCQLQPVVGAVIGALAVAHHRGRVLVFVAQDSCTAKELFFGWHRIVGRLIPPTESSLKSRSITCVPIPGTMRKLNLKTQSCHDSPSLSGNHCWTLSGQDQFSK